MWQHLQMYLNFYWSYPNEQNQWLINKSTSNPLCYSWCCVNVLLVFHNYVSLIKLIHKELKQHIFLIKFNVIYIILSCNISFSSCFFFKCFINIEQTDIIKIWNVVYKLAMDVKLVHTLTFTKRKSEIHCIKQQETITVKFQTQSILSLHLILWF
jgi:hypothetical protein